MGDLSFMGRGGRCSVCCLQAARFSSSARRVLCACHKVMIYRSIGGRGEMGRNCWANILVFLGRL